MSVDQLEGGSACSDRKGDQEAGHHVVGGDRRDRLYRLLLSEEGLELLDDGSIDFDVAGGLVRQFQQRSIVIDDGDSVVELSRFYLDFCVDESCGKCAPCRIGGTQMLHLLDKIVAGEGTLEDIKTIRMIAQAMQKGSLCALGQTAPNPVLSALKHFESEFTERLKTPEAAEA